MHLLAFTPIDVGADELRRRQKRYDDLVPTGVSVELRDIGGEAPRALDTEDDVRLSEDVLSEAFRTVDPRGFDGFLPDCVLDPCAEVADTFERPLYGLSKLTASLHVSLGCRVGALARNRAIATELDRRLSFYGFETEPTRVMDLAVHDIADSRAWGRAVTEHAQLLNCSVAINACSAVELVDPPARPRVVDPTGTALGILGFAADLDQAS
ncbi:hydantoin racemase [Actinomycetes bacterium M1A6_2h]